MSFTKVGGEVSASNEYDFQVQKGLGPGEISDQIDRVPIDDEDKVVSISEIKCLQYNVCSFSTIGNRKYIADGFTKLKFHVGFFQEGRYPKSRLMKHGDILMCISGQKAGGSMDVKFGCPCQFLLPA